MSERPDAGWHLSVWARLGNFEAAEVTGEKMPILEIRNTKGEGYV